VEIGGLVECKLLRRLNRFVLEVEIEGNTERAHLRDSGRLSELMKKGNRVFVRRKRGEKTSYEVFVIWDGDVPVVVNSSLHTKLATEILEKERYKILRREVLVDGSRIDLLVERDGVERLVEVKGCTLVLDSIALFPDAPTARGVRHVKIIEKHGGMILFLVMRDDARFFMPNFKTHPEFARELKRAFDSGVEVRASVMKPKLTGNKLIIKHERDIPVYFKGI